MKKLLFLVLAFSILSCTSNKLKREDALQILKRDFKQECYQGVINSNIYYYGNYYQKISKYKDYNLSEINNYLKQLKNEGYITSIKDTKISINFNLTAKGKKYRTSKTDMKGYLYIVGESEVVDVLGIAQNKNTGTAIVKFRFKYKPSPFYNLRRYKYKKQNRDKCTGKFHEQEVEFIKFDDRWEIKK